MKCYPYPSEILGFRKIWAQNMQNKCVFTAAWNKTDLNVIHTLNPFGFQQQQKNAINNNNKKPNAMQVQLHRRMHSYGIQNNAETWDQAYIQFGENKETVFYETSKRQQEKCHHTCIQNANLAPSVSTQISHRNTDQSLLQANPSLKQTLGNCL